jgi:cell division cycle 14
VLRAVQDKVFNFQKFVVEEYEYYSRLDKGDINVILPNKFLAFSSPHDGGVNAEDMRAFEPGEFVSSFFSFFCRMSSD